MHKTLFAPRAALTSEVIPVPAASSMTLALAISRSEWWAKR